MGKSNLRSNFTPEVVLWLFLRMRTKSDQKWPKLRLCTKPGAENLSLYNVNALRMCNGKLGKKLQKRTWRRHGPFAKTSHRKENESCKNLLIKWLSNERRNDFVVNKSRMSIDRPKPANSNTRKTVYAKVL